MARNSTPAAAAADTDVVGIPVEAFITDASVRIQVAGLLASKPELRIAEIPREQWQAELDAYLTSKRP